MVDLALLVALTIGLTELFKRSLKVDGRYLPLISLALGIAMSVIWLDASAKESVLMGIIVGLSSSGLFDHTKILGGDK